MDQTGCKYPDDDISWGPTDKKNKAATEICAIPV